MGEEFCSVPVLFCLISDFSLVFFPDSAVLQLLFYPNSSSCSGLRSQKILGDRCTILVTLSLVTRITKQGTAWCNRKWSKNYNEKSRWFVWDVF